jgi:AAA+ ATPase superfamily predicted ATPase
MEQENLIAKCGTKRGCYRLLEKDSPIIDFMNVRLSDPLNLKWPFGLEDYVEIYPGNVIVVAGSRNAGKTAFLLNFVKQNMGQHKIEYFSSEMGPEELAIRLLAFEDMKLSEWKFVPRKRVNMFADAILPNAINIIDYLEVTKDFFEIGGYISDIFNNLDKGIAIIAIQKEPGRDSGRGGEFTLEKPRMALAIDKGKLKIVKGKIWASETNPDGMEWEFKLVKGARFIETGGTKWKVS